MHFPGQMLYHFDDTKKTSAPFHFPDTFFNLVIDCLPQIPGIFSSINFPFRENIPFGAPNFLPEYFFGCPYSSEGSGYLFLLALSIQCIDFSNIPSKASLPIERDAVFIEKPSISDQSTATISFLRLVTRTSCILKFWSIIIIIFSTFLNKYS